MEIEMSSALLILPLHGTGLADVHAKRRSMTKVELLAAFVERAHFEDISKHAIERMKLNILDTLGCAIGALSGAPIQAIRSHTQELSRTGTSTLIGGGSANPVQASFHNGSLVRYLDFMDNYMARMQSGHPCDTFSPVLTAAEYANASGKDLLLGLVLAYQIFCVLLDHFPVQEKGFDHTVQLAIAESAATAKLLGLSLEECANAIALSATSLQGLVEVRSDYLSNWKGLASAFVGKNALEATMLARRGITGPALVFEGVRGLQEVTGQKFDIDWTRSDLERVLRTSIKRYNSEIHSQAAIEGMIELANEHDLKAETIDKIELEIFRQANNIIGEGTESGHKKKVFTKEQADHSIFYLLAVAILDREVTPKQYEESRILSADVQTLLQKIEAGRKSNIAVLDSYTNAYPEEMRCKITVTLKNATTLVCEKKDYYGFFKRPMSETDVIAKFNTLTEQFTDAPLREKIVETVLQLDRHATKDLTSLLAQVKAPPLAVA